MQNLELETIHSLLDEVKEYTIDEIAADFLDDPNDSVCKLGLFVALREDEFWFKHNRNLTYTPRTADELEILRIQLARQKDVRKELTAFSCGLSSSNQENGMKNQYELQINNYGWINCLIF